MLAFGLLHGAEVEALYHLLHQLADGLVAEVTDAAFVGVVHLFAGYEATGFDVEAYLLIGVAEGHPFAGEAVDLLHTEDGGVTLVVEDVGVDLHLLDDVGGHLEAILQLLEGGQENLFDNLQVAEVAAGQVVGYHHNLLGQGL